MGISKFYINLTPRFLLSSIDKIIYLILDETTRKERITNRKKVSKRDQRNLDKGTTMDKQYKNILPQNTLYISTNNKTPKVIAKEILTALKI